jgi:pyruvate dehydrogenase E2 component (dihydrolipoamide acetyltransferase)
MPKFGNSVEECLLVEWQVEVGQEVSKDDILCTIETDKATFDVPATAGGHVLALLHEDGDLVPVLTNIAVVGAKGEDPAPAAASTPEAPAEEAAVAPTPQAEPAPGAAAAAAAPPGPRSCGQDRRRSLDGRRLRSRRARG